MGVGTGGWEWWKRGREDEGENGRKGGMRRKTEGKEEGK